MSTVNPTWSGILHVHAQYQWHDDAFIVGDREALTQLRAAIDAALAAEDGLGRATTFTGDGEGFTAHVVRIDAQRMERMRLPYTSLDHPDVKGRYPSSLVRQRPEDEIESDDEWFAMQRAHGFEFEAPGPVDVIAAASRPE